MTSNGWLWNAILCIYYYLKLLYMIISLSHLILKTTLWVKVISSVYRQEVRTGVAHPAINKPMIDRLSRILCCSSLCFSTLQDKCKTEISSFSALSFLYNCLSFYLEDFTFSCHVSFPPHHILEPPKTELHPHHMTPNLLQKLYQHLPFYPCAVGVLRTTFFSIQ